MNHLHIHNGCEIIFDSSDAKPANVSAAAPENEKDEQIDITDLLEKGSENKIKVILQNDQTILKID